MRIAPLVLAAPAVLLLGCGPSEPAIRMHAVKGRKLVYEMTHRDERLGSDKVLEMASRFSMEYVGDGPQGSSSYRVTVEAFRASSNEQLGFAVDTETLAPEPDDRHGVEVLVRGLLGVAGTLAMTSIAGPVEIEKQAPLREAIAEWAKAGGPERKAIEGALLVMLDPASLAASSLQPASFLIPRESYAEDGATWKSRTPHRPTPAGKIQALLDVTCRKPEPGIVVLLGKGVFESSELTMGSGPRFLGGSIDLRTEIDVTRGVILLVEEKAKLEFTDARSGEPFTLDQVRRVRLVESSADDDE